jgi:hypothetical protein
MRIVTVEEIEYRPAGTLERFTIPAGTICIPADNLPGSGQFWACEWEGMSEAADSWARNYGFLLDASDVAPVVIS